MAALFAPTTAAVTSNEVAVTSTAPVTLAFAFDPAVVVTPTRLQVEIQKKGSDNKFTFMRWLNGKEMAVTINGAGTYRVKKGVTAQAVGIDTN